MTLFARAASSAPLLTLAPLQPVVSSTPLLALTPLLRVVSSAQRPFNLPSLAPLHLLFLRGNKVRYALVYHHGKHGVHDSLQ